MKDKNKIPTFKDLQFDVREVWNSYAVEVNGRIIADIAKTIFNKYFKGVGQRERTKEMLKKIRGIKNLLIILCVLCSFVFAFINPFTSIALISICAVVALLNIEEME